MVIPWQVMSMSRVVAYDGKKWDVFSTAVLLLTMWTCQYPYQELTPPQIIAGVSSSLGLRPAIPDSVPQAVIDLVTDMWKELPDERPSFELVVHRLESNEFQPDGAVQKKPVSTKALLKRGTFRNA